MHSKDFDIAVKNAEILDGTGASATRADIGIVAGKIAEIRDRIDFSRAHQVIDGVGKIVSPGFIDTHSHDDIYVLVCSSCDQKLLQGVTSLVIGNCGYSMGPISRNFRQEFIKAMSFPGGKYLPSESWNFSALGEYLTMVEEAKPSVNIIPLVGHATVRIAVMGKERRAPSSEELEEMRELVTQGMEDGAFGMSSGLIYVPAHYSETEEILALTKVVNAYGGIYTTHIRSESDRCMDAIEEALKIGRLAGVPVVISHLKALGRANWGKSREILRRLETASQHEGLEVAWDQYPYSAMSTFLIATLPPDAQEGGEKVLTDRLRDPKFRLSVIEQIEDSDGTWENLIKASGFDNIVLAIAPKHASFVGRTLAEIAAREGKNPFDLVFDLLISEGQAAGIICRAMEEGDITRILRSSNTMIGSDGVPDFGGSKIHPRQTGTFPRVLGRYARERKVLPLEEAVRRMTSLPAKVFGLKSKGLVRKGLDADLVIFDRQKIADGSTFENPTIPPLGIEWVLVNGVVAAKGGTVTNAGSGQVLRRFRH